MERKSFASVRFQQKGSLRIHAFIEDNGIELEENDQVEVVKSEGTSRSISTTALHVVKRDGSETEEYFLLSYEEQENGDVVPADVPLETSMARGSQSITYTPGYAKLISIVGTVGYTTERVKTKALRIDESLFSMSL